MPEKLKTKKLLSELKPTFDLFYRLSKRRNWTEVGPSRLAWEAIQAFKSVAHCDPKPWEIEAILRLDDAFVEVWFEKKQ